jgi:uncharacterized protein YecT (DUF1311 family)
MAQDKMAHDQNAGTQLVASGGGMSRRMLLAGVVGACALGVGAGLWARPAESERRVVAVAAPSKVAAVAKPSRVLEIVLDEKPAPIGAPIEVLPAVVGPPPQIALPPSEPTPLAPMRPPVGLVRVQAVEPLPELAVAPAPKAAPKARPPEVKVSPEPKRAKHMAASKKPAEPRIAKAEPAKSSKAKDRPAKGRLAKAEPVVAKVKGKAKAEPASAPKKPRLAKALAKVTPKAVKQTTRDKKHQIAEARKARAETARLEKVRLEKVRLAKVEKARLAKGKVVKPKTQMVALKSPPKLEKPAARPKAAKLPKPTRDNPIRKASNRCASADPGAALVCADASLSAADRQLDRAYRKAEAAGVSTAQLARQQQRWLAARAQAARDAPWAVRDVYEARIAELNDMSRESGRSY